MNKKGIINLVLWVIAIGVILLLAGALLLCVVYKSGKSDSKDSTHSVFSDVIDSVTGNTSTADGVESFTSAEDFLEYINNAPNNDGDSGVFARSFDTLEVTSAEPLAQDFETGADFSGEVLGSVSKSETVDRVSETNVQVQGIDEPDVVKTDGESLFISELFSNQEREIEFPEFESGIDIEDSFIGDSRIAEPYYYDDYYYPSKQVSKVIDALPVDELEILAEIDASGELMLYDDILMVIKYNEIVAYDVSNPEKPAETWKLELADNTSYKTSRLYNGELYVVTTDYFDYTTPCPYQVLEGDIALEVACNDIWYPVTPAPADVTYTAMRINTTTGEVDDAVAFVGSIEQSVVYMSEDHLYITYVVPPNPLDVMYDFFTNEGKNLVEDKTRNRLAELRSYDLSSQSQQTELGLVMQDLYTNLEDEDDQLQYENELENASQSFLDTHKRELEYTGIIKIDITGDIDVAATGSVPGVPLNQFSLDEHEGNLRITTTVGEPNWRYWYYSFGSQDETVNDLYVLDTDLDELGTVQDLGEGERIYSTRFVGDMGYMVTFREIDPFYVFDLSNPNNPQKTGELKIPGFSSYLHPLTDTLMLGVGEEDNKVKVSLFDVSDETDPQEISKYQLDEYWSQAGTNQNAFLQDAEFEVFFIPGGQGGYIFSYTNNEITLEKAVSNVNARRAVYVNDYLYIIGSDTLVVLDETTWDRVAELDLTQ